MTGVLPRHSLRTKRGRYVHRNDCSFENIRLFRFAHGCWDFGTTDYSISRTPSRSDWSRDCTGAGASRKAVDTDPRTVAEIHSLRVRWPAGMRGRRGSAWDSRERPHGRRKRRVPDANPRNHCAKRHSSIAGRGI